MIKGMYLSASDQKAIAISSNRAAIITLQKDEETAKSAAVDAGTNQSGMPIPCELYAIGNVVVSKRGNPPMPPQPWIARNPSIETQFVVSDVPVTSAARGRIESGYAKGGKPKALAIPRTDHTLMHTGTQTTLKRPRSERWRPAASHPASHA
jgi:adenylate cyclase